MRQFKIEERKSASRRDLEFIYQIACEEEQIAVYGHDLINCFYFISATSRDPDLRRTASMCCG